MRWVKDIQPRNCEYCKTTFYVSRNSNRKYCSRECGFKSREKDLTWKTFWNLTVIKKIRHAWKCIWIIRLCKCKCWNLLEKTTSKLLNWNNQSCWCFRRKSYWLVKDKFYYKYNSMHQRCEDVKADSYHRYWWRWIKCEWETFQDFYRDMYSSYVEHCKKFWESNTTLDRIDSNWNYCKENCRRATIKEQANNRSTNRFIEYNWEKLTVSQRACKIWITYSALAAKLWRNVPIEWIVKHPHKRWYSHYDIETQLARYM